jgi:hypothetical protein
MTGVLTITETFADSGCCGPTSDMPLAEEINEAIEIVHLRSILSAASLMIGGPTAAEAMWHAKSIRTSW